MSKRGLNLRRSSLGLAIVLSALAAGAAIAYVLSVGADQDAAVTRQPPPATAAIVRGAVRTVVRVQGSLQFAGGGTARAGLSGVVTWLPRPGTRVDFGQRLYSVDDEPVVLLRGSVPMWRPFVAGMFDGPDVEQLETDLQEMGYFIGTVDERFDAQTSEAIERLQDALGESCARPPSRNKPAHGDRTPRRLPSGDQPTCGELALGSVVFGEHSIRVAKPDTAPGVPVAPGSSVLTVSATQKVVHANIDLDDQSVARRGTTATVTLPDGRSAKGVVTGVGPATERQTGDLSSAVIPVTIALRKPERASDFDQAAVSVAFAVIERRNVLSVQVDALVALGDNRFGIDVRRRSGAIEQLAVHTGAFAGGRVVISGHGVHGGLRVVVPEI